MAASASGKPLVIVYHADCIDGAASAWVISKARGIESPAAQANVTYIPYEHSDAAAGEQKIRDALSAGAEIYFADVIPEKKFLDELMSRLELKAVHILDHHKSATEVLKGYTTSARLNLHINPTAPSAASMIWQHLFPSKKPPAIIDLIARMDGDAAGLKTPRDFAAAAYADSKNIHTPDHALQTLRSLARLSFNDMAKKGAPVVEDQTVRLDALMENAATVQLQILPGTAPVSVPIVNANVRHFGRQVSGRLVALGKKEGTGVAFAWFVQKTGAVTMSIRTNGDPDASAIAAHLRNTMGVTGGGHKADSAVHFSSVFEFARQMHLQTSKTTLKPPAPPSPF